MCSSAYPYDLTITMPIGWTCCPFYYEYRIEWHSALFNIVYANKKSNSMCIESIKKDFVSKHDERGLILT